MPNIPCLFVGLVLAFEVSDLDAEVARLQQRGVRFRREITETPFAALPSSWTQMAVKSLSTNEKHPHDSSA
jgi:hypothetical protein